MHKWIKGDYGWSVFCEEYDDQFDTQFWFNNPLEKGLCPFCGKNAEEEMKLRKQKFEEERQKKKKEKEKNNLKKWLD